MIRCEVMRSPDCELCIPHGCRHVCRDGTVGVNGMNHGLQIVLLPTAGDEEGCFFIASERPRDGPFIYPLLLLRPGEREVVCGVGRGISESEVEAAVKLGPSRL